MGGQRRVPLGDHLDGRLTCHNSEERDTGLPGFRSGQRYDSPGGRDLRRSSHSWFRLGILPSTG
jgi:hypothetical protein